LLTLRFDETNAPASGLALSSRVSGTYHQAAWAESWSGYALQMTGSSPALARFPLLDDAGRPKLAIESGTVRF
jgi:hypothetical protein